MSCRRTGLAVVVLAVVLLAVPGCPQRLHVEKTLTLEPGDIKQPAVVDGPRSQQKIRVQIDATEPINVDIALESDAADIEKSLLTASRPAAAKLLASKQGVKSDAVEATIPAGKSYTVILSGAKKKSEVKLKVNSI